MVKRVVHFQPKFVAQPFGDVRFLVQVHIPDIPPRFIQNITSRVAEARLAGYLVRFHELRRKARGIEPAIHCPLTGRQAPVADTIRPLVQGAGSRNISSGSNGEGKS